MTQETSENATAIAELAAHFKDPGPLAVATSEAFERVRAASKAGLSVVLTADQVRAIDFFMRTLAMTGGRAAIQTAIDAHARNAPAPIATKGKKNTP